MTSQPPLYVPTQYAMVTGLLSSSTAYSKNEKVKLPVTLTLTNLYKIVGYQNVLMSSINSNIISKYVLYITQYPTNNLYYHKDSYCV